MRPGATCGTCDRPTRSPSPVPVQFDGPGAVAALPVQLPHPQLVKQAAPVAADGEHEKAALQRQQQRDEGVQSRLPPGPHRLLHRAAGRARPLVPAAVPRHDRGRVVQDGPAARRRLAEAGERRRVLRRHENRQLSGDVAFRRDLPHALDVLFGAAANARAKPRATSGSPTPPAALWVRGT